MSSREPFDLSGRHETGDPEDLSCRRCLRARPTDALDRLLWCDDCRAAERRIAARWGRLGGVAIALGLICWIVIVVAPSQNRFLIFWAAAVLVVYRLTGRLFHELAYGLVRVKNVRGARAGEYPAA